MPKKNRTNRSRSTARSLRSGTRGIEKMQIDDVVDHIPGVDASTPGRIDANLAHHALNDGLGAKVPQHLDLVQMTLSERTEVEPPLPENMVALLNWGNGSLACVACGLDPDARVFYADHEIEGSSERISVENTDFLSWLTSMIEAL